MTRNPQMRYQAEARVELLNLLVYNAEVEATKSIENARVAQAEADQVTSNLSKVFVPHLINLILTLICTLAMPLILFIYKQGPRVWSIQKFGTT